MLVTAGVPVSAMAVSWNLSVAVTDLFALTVNLVGFIEVRPIAIVSRYRCFRCVRPRRGRGPRIMPEW